MTIAEIYARHPQLTAAMYFVATTQARIAEP
jgi:hypothetical protein